MPEDPHNLFREWIKTLAGITLVLGLVLAVGVVLWMKSIGVFSLSEKQLRLITDTGVPDNTVVYDRKGNRIGEFFNRYQVYVPYAEIPKDLIHAIVAIEDRQFFLHPGFDPRGIIRALWVSLREKSYAQGASTLTQQLVRHFLLGKEKTMSRKVKEIVLAFQLERRLSKERIIELYANVMFLGNGAYGVGAAAERYFGRKLSALGLPELALIAGLFQSPSGYNPSRYPQKAVNRQRQVLRAMVDSDYLSLEEASKAENFPLRFTPYRHLDPHPFFVDYVEQEAEALVSRREGIESKGLRIHTTLDPDLQKIAEQTVEDAPRLWQNALRTSKNKSHRAFPLDTLETALIALDPQNGEILAMVGGRQYSKSQFNRATNSSRSPGSSFKPVVYSLALQQGYRWNTQQYLDPVTVKDYRPRNYGGEFLTETTLLRSLYRSFNTTAVELANTLGIPNMLAHAKKLGIQSPLKPEIGTALGSSDVSPLDMARAFGVFANGGQRVDTAVVSRIEDRGANALYRTKPPEYRSSRILSPEVAYLMTEGLRTVLTHGTASAARSLANVAVGKTGTSNGAKDNWFCGYTSNLVVVVWVGTDTGAELPTEAAGSTLALPLWQGFLERAFATRPPAAFPRPAGIEEAMVNPFYGHRVRKGGVRMFFLSGESPSEEKSPLQVLSDRGNYRRIFE